MGESSGRERWHVGREVPIALILGMLVQTGVAVWWARGKVADVDDHERRLTALEKERDVVRVSERMAVIEAALSDIRRSNERTEALLQQAIQQSRNRP
jgi:hypothetical protein